MRQVVELNRTILEQWYQLTSQYSFHVGATSLTRLSQTMSGTMLVKSEEKDVSQHFTDLAKQLQKLA